MAATSPTVQSSYSKTVFNAQKFLCDHPSAINVTGLALGIASCLIIVLYVEDELGYDRYNQKADRIVRVIFRGAMQRGEIKEANVMPPVAQALKNDFPEVLEATRLRYFGQPRLVSGSKILREDATTALRQPNSVVTTRAVAQRFFGNEDPIGKILVSKEDYKKLEAKLPGEIDKYIGPQMKQGLGITLDEFRKKGISIGLFLQPLTDIHLHSGLTGELEAGGDISYEPLHRQRHPARPGGRHPQGAGSRHPFDRPSI